MWSPPPPLPRYLVGSNERVHSQVVLDYFLCHVWWVGQGSAPEQSGGASVARLARWTGLHVTEERVPRLEKERRSSSTRIKCVTAGVWHDRREICSASTINVSYLHSDGKPVARIDCCLYFKIGVINVETSRFTLWTLLWSSSQAKYISST